MDPRNQTITSQVGKGGLPPLMFYQHGLEVKAAASGSSQLRGIRVNSWIVRSADIRIVNL